MAKPQTRLYRKVRIKAIRVKIVQAKGKKSSLVTYSREAADTNWFRDVSPTTTTDSSASSTSSAAVSPATSGLAEYDCTNGTTMYSAQPQGLAYIQHCNTMYAYWNEDIFQGGKVIPLQSSTKYSLESCVNACDSWNEDNPDADQPCRSVSYYANLTTVFTEHPDWKGNCILKSGVSGVTTNATSDDAID